MNDQLVECKRCKGNACYEQNIDNNLQTWLCMGCGFTTSTVMDKGGKAHTNLIETSPELYVDLLFEDDTNKIWAPATITLPNKGMVFLDGTNSKEWKWASVKSILITDEDRKLKSFPADQTHKMDMKNIKHYDQKDFMTALEYIDFYQI